MSISGNPRWALLLHKQCTLLVRVMRQWQLCWEVAAALAALQRQPIEPPDQQQPVQAATSGPQSAAVAGGQVLDDGEARCAAAVPAPGRMFDAAALLAALPSVGPELSHTCWAAATNADASLSLAVMHQLEPVARQAAAKQRPGLLYGLAVEIGAAFGEWQQECEAAAAGGLLGLGHLSLAGVRGSREAPVIAEALVAAGCVVPAQRHERLAAGSSAVRAQETAEVHWQPHASEASALQISVQRSVVRYQLHVEALRAWAWCAQLLGVDL